MVWFEEEYIFNEKNVFKPCVKSWKRSWDDVHILGSDGSEALDFFLSGNLISKNPEWNSQLKEKTKGF